MDRTERLLEPGYFPAQLPPPFTTAMLAHHHRDLLASWSAIKGTAPSCKPELIEKVSGQLNQFSFADIAEPARVGAPRDLFAFVEAYFSNYVEGTTFKVEEAEEIVLMRSHLGAHIDAINPLPPPRHFFVPVQFGIGHCVTPR